MKWLVLVCFFVTFNAAAQEAVCPEEEISEIDKLEQEWKKCAVVDYGKDGCTEAYDFAQEFAHESNN